MRACVFNKFPTIHFFLLRAYCNFFPIIINEWLRMVVKQPNFQFPLYHCATIAQALAGPADDFII